MTDDKKTENANSWAQKKPVQRTSRKPCPKSLQPSADLNTIWIGSCLGDNYSCKIRVTRAYCQCRDVEGSFQGVDCNTPHEDLLGTYYPLHKIVVGC
jgi:hypothetical protein